MAGKKLEDAHKRYIVEGLACFVSHAEIIEGLNVNFGVEVTWQQLQRYDPTKANGATLGKEYRELFETSRQSYVQNLGNIGIANTAFRLEALGRMAREAEAKKNYVLAASLLEQAAKDRGGVFTNHQKISGRIDTNAKVTGEVKVEHSYTADELRDLPADELVRVHRETLGVSRESRWK